MNRRALLRAVTGSAAGAALTLLPGIAAAQAAWPSQKPIRIIEVSAPGGSGDVMARMVAGKLAARLGQSVVVENRVGAGGTLGTDAVAKAAPDGYTLLLDNSAIATNSASGKKLPYEPIKDFIRIGQIAATPLVVVVPADSPIKTLRQLVDAARVQPDAVRYGSSGVGSMSHIGMELLAATAKAPLMHVPYKGLPLSTADLLAGRLQASLSSVATNAALLDSGKLRAIVATSPTRSPFLPNLPTSAEAGLPDFQIEYWWGLSGPAGMPADVVQRLNGELNTILADADTRAFLARVAATPKPGTPGAFDQLVTFEISRWSQLIRDAGIKME